MIPRTKPPNRAMANNGSAGRYKGGPANDYSKYLEDPTTYKRDREDRIFDTQGFKDAVDRASKTFMESMPHVPPMDKPRKKK